MAGDDGNPEGQEEYPPTMASRQHQIMFID